MNDDTQQAALSAVDAFVAQARNLVQDMDILIDDLKALLAEQDQT
jgi:hypothetical protein